MVNQQVHFVTVVELRCRVMRFQWWWRYAVIFVHVNRWQLQCIEMINDAQLSAADGDAPWAESNEVAIPDVVRTHLWCISYQVEQEPVSKDADHEIEHRRKRTRGTNKSYAPTDICGPSPDDILHKAPELVRNGTKNRGGIEYIELICRYHKRPGMWCCAGWWWRHASHTSQCDMVYWIAYKKCPVLGRILCETSELEGQTLYRLHTSTDTTGSFERHIHEPLIEIPIPQPITSPGSMLDEQQGLTETAPELSSPGALTTRRRGMLSL